MKEETTELTQQQALNILIQAAKVGQSKGAYTLEEAELIAKSVKVFVKAEEATKPASDATPVAPEMAAV